MHKIVFNPVISPAAWEIGMSLLPKGFKIELLSPDPERRIPQLESANFLMGFLRGMQRFGHSYANIERVARGEPPLWVVPELR